MVACAGLMPRAGTVTLAIASHFAFRFLCLLGLLDLLSALTLVHSPGSSLYLDALINLLSPSQVKLPAATRNFYVDGHVPQPH